MRPAKSSLRLITSTAEGTTQTWEREEAEAVAHSLAASVEGDWLSLDLEVDGLVFIGITVNTQSLPLPIAVDLASTPLCGDVPCVRLEYIELVDDQPVRLTATTGTLELNACSRALGEAIPGALVDVQVSDGTTNRALAGTFELGIVSSVAGSIRCAGEDAAPDCPLSADQLCAESTSGPCCESRACVDRCVQITCTFASCVLPQMSACLPCVEDCLRRCRPSSTCEPLYETLLTCSANAECLRLAATEDRPQCERRLCCSAVNEAFSSGPP